MSLTALAQVLGGANKVAYATSLDNVPNLRIVNFVWDETTPNVLYFASVRDSRGVQEFLASDRIAFSTVPETGNAHVASNQATGQASQRTLAQMQPQFLAQVPDFAHVLELIGPKLALYEIRITSAEVDQGLGNGVQQVTF
ncbi:hypothetical protein MK904_04640 [Loigolactobacillus coryniformis]|uniref:Pyridoxamine 5'-phosphate oxidase-like domain-containing protein n=3 Tax=Loigolactobacillus coryniformis TaxID=1610 RepID=A0A0R1F5E2_9LACO|nr:hypothetical protein [Loigolactobacillus coryniformis]MDT3390720.1 hypothetical protein [Bacillota bacterium]OEH89537.1 hypothetical protein ATO00_10600 [Loigolactobacillus coryniformis subsp. coryniformis]ATO43907.1 hypothetical protein LC20004_08260 [Loigolactobacillus coryniformis subsp. torquens DSM 20004 = KCTC 3535]ATO55587.1 hypothetical protein LC20001_08010 [Loigolactobacillus coryniformis subsp. coryniformis KCTC 3167 = DSM 20001]KRK17052.1 hypothetical protein FD22_GL001024 [Loig